MIKLSFRIFLITCITMFVSQISAQTPVIEWENTIGGTDAEELRSIQQTSDGGYILGGESQSGISGDKTEALIGGADYWVVKLDDTGAIDWQNTIGGDDYDALYSIQQTSDGGYILGGVSRSGISGDKTEANEGLTDYWVIKLDDTGAIDWQNTIGGDHYDYLISIKQTSDEGYILGGYSSSGISGDKTEAVIGGSMYDYWVVKLDDTGAIDWQNTIGGTSQDYLHSIQQTSDGGYILGGWSISGISGDKTEALIGIRDYWVIKLDDTGAIDWQNTIGGTSMDELKSIQQTSDGGYILGGHSYSGISGDKTEALIGDSDYWVVKLDDTGAIEWQNTIGGTDYDEFFPGGIQQTRDGGYIVGGDSWSGISGDKTEAIVGETDYWVVKLDDTGDIEWQNTIGGADEEYLAGIQQTSDGGYIFGGYSESGISGDKTEAVIGGSMYDYWIVKLGPESEAISGFVRDGSNNGIEGVDVVFSNGGATVATSSSGYYSTSVTEGWGGTSTATKEGWIFSPVSYTYPIVLTSLTNQNYVGTAAPSSVSISGFVRDGSNIGMEGFSVAFSNGGATVTTSSSGYYFTSVTNGWSGTSTATKEGWVCAPENYTYSAVTANLTNQDYVGSPEQLGITDNLSTVPERFTVLPAYPNPFNPSTTISYGIDSDSRVIIQIYDLSGRIISTLQDNNQTQGWHSIVWNGTNRKGEQVPAGVYFSRITSDSEVKTSKLMLLK